MKLYATPYAWLVSKEIILKLHAIQEGVMGAQMGTIRLVFLESVPWCSP
jgi:hypothetical protein